MRRPPLITGTITVSRRAADPLAYGDAEARGLGLERAWHQEFHARIIREDPTDQPPREAALSPPSLATGDPSGA